MNENTETPEIEVHNVSVNHLDKQIIIRGMIQKIEPTKLKLIKGAFKCQGCGEVVQITQDDSDLLIKPIECEIEACGRKKFELLQQESEWIDQRIITLRDSENYEEEIKVVVRGIELINKIPSSGAIINITGLLKIISQKKQFRLLQNINHSAILV
ncbi:MAG TPA: hypothetical protein VF360_03885, partial [Candidatus Methanoperedens sp.]